MDLKLLLKYFHKVISLPAFSLILVIRIYKFLISPLLPSACRHYPTCSEYAVEAISKYGFLKGGWMAGIRILKCNPFFKGGYDPVR